jgi:hypothetical protein
MATLAIVAAGLVFALALVWVGVQGLRGVPDSNGKVTPKGTAVACLVIAGILVIASAAAPFFMGGH